jgi:hypothetical protein
LKIAFAVSEMQCSLAELESYNKIIGSDGNWRVVAARGGLYPRFGLDLLLLGFCGI